MEILLEIILEFLVTLIFEFSAEFGLRSANHILYNKRTNVYVSLLGYIVLAIIFAGISLLVFKNHFFQNENLRHYSLLIMPIILGLLMKYKGSRMQRKGLDTIKLDSFWYGFSFALTFGLVRYLLAS